MLRSLLKCRERSQAGNRCCHRRPASPHPPPSAPDSAELGIDIPAILSRTRSIMTFRLAGHDMDHLDMGGPLIFMALLGAAHLLVRARAPCSSAAHAVSRICHCRTVQNGACAVTGVRLSPLLQHSVCQGQGLKRRDVCLPQPAHAASRPVLLLPPAGGQDAFWLHPGLDGGGRYASVVRLCATSPASGGPPQAAASPARRRCHRAMLVGCAAASWSACQVCRCHDRHSQPCRSALSCAAVAACRFVLNSITGSDDPDAKALDLYSCTCLLGYALLPLVGHALLALALPR